MGRDERKNLEMKMRVFIIFLLLGRSQVKSRKKNNMLKTFFSANKCFSLEAPRSYKNNKHVGFFEVMSF